MARKNAAGIFLLLIAALAVVVGLSKVILTVFDEEAMQLAFIPSHPIAEEEMPPAPDYTKDESWAKLPIDMDSSEDIFFIHPTTFTKPSAWNAAYDDASAQPMLKSIALKNMASAFKGNLYIPRYRQATTGAFFDESGQGDIAKGRAYQDILAAYDNFIKRRDQSRPFTLVGHSQGALHLLNLLKDRVADSPARGHLGAAYIIGWPVSIEEDLETVGMKACENAEETGCVISWMSFAQGADTSGLKAWYDTSLGLSGNPRADSTQLCTNPLNWSIAGEADASLNMGSVVLTPGDVPLPEPIANLTGATCKDGFLFVSPTLGEEWHVMDMGGGNLHWYDINLFYMNIREKTSSETHAGDYVNQ